MEEQMTDHHPITPPPELVQQWMNEIYEKGNAVDSDHFKALAARAAQRGADQELEACCELLKQKGVPAWSLLRLHRRPKPPSLKKQALEALAEWENVMDITPDSPIRRALETLTDKC